MVRVVVACALAGALMLQTPAAFAHGAQMLLGSTAQNSGALVLSYDFTDKIVASPSVSLGGMTLYTSIFPGFEWLQVDQVSPPPYPLKVGTPFSMQIVSIDGGASVMLGSVTLKTKGQSGFVATTTNVPGDHFHPQWQLLLPDRVSGDYTVSFKVTTTVRTYTASEVYTLVITNVPDATETPPATPSATASVTPTPQSGATATPPAPTDTPSPTPMPSTTPSATASPTLSPDSTATDTPGPTPVPLSGDANCDGNVSVADLPAEVELLATSVPPPCGADVNGDGIVDQQDLAAIVDALFAP